MKIFISWSGELSHRVALELRDWLPMVINALEPYVSSKDIEKGADWFADIQKNLVDSRFGIVCVTRENVNKPWILFESGAIVGKLGAAYATPLFIDLSPADVTNPLSKFQGTKIEKDDFLTLLKSINKLLEDKGVTERLLEKSFNRLWNELEEAIEKVKTELADLTVKAKTELADSTATEDNPPKRTEREIMEETLEIVRRLAQPTLRSYYEASVKPISDLRTKTQESAQPAISVVSPFRYRYEILVNNFDRDKLNKFLQLAAIHTEVRWFGISTDQKAIDLVLVEELSHNLLHVLADEAGLEVINVLDK